MSFILGKKLGMTRIFDDSGDHVSATLIQAGPCWITQVKIESTDGYNAVQIGFEKMKEKNINKPKSSHLKKANVGPVRFLKEFRMDEAPELKAGDQLGADRFQAGQLVNISGYSKGRGFTGVMKRHGFAGSNASHGAHEVKRHGGSIGAHTDPGKVWKGQRMPGRMGNDRTTVKNLSVLRVEPEHNLLLIKGSVPGATNSILEIVISNKQS
ncbi:50S ribosomal protein L3 [candidate division LCP-89 bacterium B3_LCP]|uniref:Large ribosomal subunit protein uL3 n=1 Tax=candidate division LCP-89 bacterium B3_LCP TaxID=2012998 RepID=A0A532UZS7_UNCL8|nr:MAG: 50S ribosomal protein L3 [candidate division LCP-89 bacterium B3_LCP]